MKLDDLIDFLVLHGVGEYQVGVISKNECRVTVIRDDEYRASLPTLIELLISSGYTVTKD
ncbi:MAG: hypothetical protein RSG77_22925 [Hafnia sp.]